MLAVIFVDVAGKVERVYRHLRVLGQQALHGVDVLHVEAHRVVDVPTIW